jgi:Family of unknown function (DUF6082)
VTERIGRKYQLISDRAAAMDESNLTRPELELSSVSPRSRRTGRILRWRMPVVILALSSALLLLIALSPLLLREIGRTKGVNWTIIANVGQAYGGASAILAGIALIGIAGSLIVQTNQARTERIRLVRERHHELLRIILENPRVYAPVMGTRTPATSEEVQQFLFATMYMNYSLMGYEMGVIDEQSLAKEILASAFAAEPFRDWWAVSGVYWSPKDATSRKERKFRRILNDQYAAAIRSQRPPIRRTIDDSPPSSPKVSQAVTKGVAAGAAIGVTIGFVLRSAIRRKLCSVLSHSNMVVFAKASIGKKFRELLSSEM